MTTENTPNPIFTPISLPALKQLLHHPGECIVFLCADSCSPCDLIGNDLVKLIAEGELNRESIYQYKCYWGDEEQRALKSMNLLGFPTILHYNNHSLIGKFRGKLVPTAPRSHHTLLKWLRKNYQKTPEAAQ